MRLSRAIRLACSPDTPDVLFAPAEEEDQLRDLLKSSIASGQGLYNDLSRKVVRLKQLRLREKDAPAAAAAELARLTDVLHVLEEAAAKARAVVEDARRHAEETEEAAARARARVEAAAEKLRRVEATRPS